MSFPLFVWDTLLVELSVGVWSLDDEVMRASIVLQTVSHSKLHMKVCAWLHVLWALLDPYA